MAKIADIPRTNGCPPREGGTRKHTGLSRNRNRGEPIGLIEKDLQSGRKCPQCLIISRHLKMTLSLQCPIAKGVEPKEHLLVGVIDPDRPSQIAVEKIERIGKIALVKRRERCRQVQSRRCFCRNPSPCSRTCLNEQNGNQNGDTAITEYSHIANGVRAAQRTAYSERSEFIGHSRPGQGQGGTRRQNR